MKSNDIFFIREVKMKIPKQILKEIRKTKQLGRGKIPILTVKDKSAKISVSLQIKNSSEHKILKTKNFELMQLGLLHLFFCN